jgi:Alcohol acetyltransferase
VRHHFIIRALRKAIQEHPALSSIVAGKDTGKPFFERIEKIDLSKTVFYEEIPSDDVEESKRVDELLSQHHSRGFDVDGLPLWRVVVFEKPAMPATPIIHITFIWHHVIGDGKSGLAVIFTILQALNSNCSQEQDLQPSPTSTGAPEASISVVPDSAIVMTPSEPLNAAVEEILSLPVSTMTTIPHVLTRMSGKWSGSPYHCEEPIKTRIRHLKLPPQTTQALADCCRVEQTTFTPFLQALVGRVIAETFQDAEHLRCAVAVSLRRLFPTSLQIDDSVMGLWVSAFHLDYTRNQLKGQYDDSSLWDQARKNSQRIESEVAKGDMDLEIGMLKGIQDFKSMLMAKMGGPREDSYAITNLGVFNANVHSMSSSGSPWQISDMVFSQSCHVNGSAVQFCVLTLKGGEMCITLSWQEGTVAGEDVARIAENLEEKLSLLGNTSDVGNEDLSLEQHGE